MTIAMPDSIRPQDLPPGYPAYLGYADGNWPTGPALKAKFPAAHILGLTVTGADPAADGIDIEPGNLDAASGADWAARKLAAAPAFRPVMYASITGEPGYGMPDVLRELSARGISRDRVRLHSAHYTGQPHICGPASCGASSVDMDGTQWTGTYPGLNGSRIDMSVLRDDFFGTPAPASTVNWTEFDMAKLRVLKQGDSDRPGEFWAVHRLQDLVNLTDRLNGIPGMTGPLVVDGEFGPATATAVRAVQAHYRIGVDGTVGAATWSVLLTGAA